MDSLYESYKISDEVINVKAKEGKYYVREIVNNKKVTGYIVDQEKQNKMFFLDHKPNQDVISKYSFQNGVVQGEDEDLTNDPRYPKEIGVNPQQPPNIIHGNPMFGTEITDNPSDSYDCGVPNTGCTCTPTTVHEYTFWIETATYPGPTNISNCG